MRSYSRDAAQSAKSTLTLFTLLGPGIVLALAGARPYRWRLLLLVFPILMATLITMAVGMRLAGRYAAAGRSRGLSSW